MTTILCVSGDHDLSDLLRYSLMKAGAETVLAYSGAQALRALRIERPDLVLLDDNLSDMVACGLLSRLRAATRALLVALSSRTYDEDVVAAFEAGADDYVVKPFSLNVLAARLMALLRRTQSRFALTPEREESRQSLYSLPGVSGVSGATFDSDRHEVSGAGRCVCLTATEGRLLRHLVAHAGYTISAAQLSRAVSTGADGSAGAIKTHMHHLRRKLADLGSGSDLIQTVPGYGYRIDAGAVSALPATSVSTVAPAACLPVAV